MNPTGVEYCDVPQFFIVGLSGSSIKIKAIILDHLVNPLDDPHLNLAASLPHLNGLHLAHLPSEATSFDGDILIGANFYRLLATKLFEAQVQRLLVIFSPVHYLRHP